MWLFEIVWLRLRSIFTGSRMDGELEEEVRFHMEAEAEDLARQGLPAAEAREVARRRFGHLTQIKEECRDARAIRVWNELLQDIRYGARSLRGTPLLSGVAVLTLALGIGANTAAFSVVYSVILRPLPYPEADRLAWVTQYFPRFEGRFVPGNDFLAWRGKAESFEALGAWSAGPFAVDTGELPEQLRGVMVSDDFFEALGVRPMAGRLFTAGEHAAGGDRAVLLSEGLWRERFAASRNVVGRTLRIYDEPHTIVGVLPASAEHVEPARFWVPLRLTMAQPGQPMHLLRVLGRLKPGVPAAAAGEELQLLARREQEALFGSASDATTQVISLHERLVGNVRQSLFLLWAAVGLVLLLACANVASLLLARLTRRAREVSLKLSLGARRSRLVRQLLIESLLLAVAGAAAGLLIANRGAAWLLRLFPEGLPGAETVSLDFATLLFTMLAAVMAAIVFGTLPALRGTKANLSDLLKSAAQTASAAAPAVRVQNALVVCQFALATVIAFHAGLLARTFINLRGVEPGFASANVLTARIDLARARYQDGASQRAFWDRLLERLSAVPGVSRVSLSDSVPLSTLTGNLTVFSVEGQPSWEPDEAPGHRSGVSVVSADHFGALNIPVIAGRAIERTDDESQQQTILINQALERRAFGAESGLGKRLKLGVPESPGPWMTIVGIVGDVKLENLQEDNQPMIYRPYYQQTSNLAVLALILQTQNDPEAIIPVLRNEVRQLDATQPVHDIATMRERLARTAAPQRERALLVGAFAVLALTLAGAGVFGVLSYLVSRRTFEFGLRMALGAERRDLLRLVLRRGLAPAGAGVGIGLIAAAFLARFTESWLFGIGATDPGAVVTTVAVLLLVGALACYLPARRASRLDPVSALRIE